MGDELRVTGDRTSGHVYKTIGLTRRRVGWDEPGSRLA